VTFGDLGGQGIMPDNPIRIYKLWHVYFKKY